MKDKRRGWEILREISRGPMSRVFLGRSPEGALVVIKALPSHQTEDLPLFEDEVRLLSKLRHPGIVSILGYSIRSREIFGEERGPCYWMEYVEGQDIVRASRGREPEKVIGWFRQALEAVEYLHSQDILHGDLSPQNLLVDQAGHLKILDFGQAGTLGRSDLPLDAAATIPYMAPERIEGRHLPASDLFSLGTIFYEALAGVHPRAGCRGLREYLRFTPLPLVEARSDLETRWRREGRLIDRMIRLDLAERFPGASAALKALEGGEPEGRDRPPGTARFQDYHSARMIGADRHFEALEKALEAGRPAVFLVHGITGVGKSRFLKEAGFQCALAGRKALFHSELETLSLEELRSLSRLHGAPPPEGCLLFLEWNDDRLEEGPRKFLRQLGALINAQEVLLKNFSEDETREFLQGTNAAEFSALLFSQTGGNPRLLLEMVREPSAGPRSLEDLLARRLASLSPGEKRLLGLLAAAREPVPYERLARVAGGEGTIGNLNRLLERQFCETTQARYRLAVPALEQAVLKDLKSEDIQEIHRSWMEALGGVPDGDAQKLHHALNLGEEGAVERGARARAEALFQSGGKEAALEVVERALPIIRNAAERSRLLRLKTNVLSGLGRFEEALQAAQAWFDLKAADEPLQLKTVKFWLVTGMIHQNLGRADEAEARLKRCLETGGGVEGAEVLPFLARVHSLLGALALERGRIEEAKGHFQNGLKQAEGRERAELCRNLGALLFGEGKRKEAEAFFEEARSLYRKENYLKGISAAFLQQGNLVLSGGDTPAAETFYREAETIAQEAKDDLGLALVWHNRGILALRRSRLGEVLDFSRRALDLFRLLGNANDLAQGLSAAAIAEAAVGRFERAEELLRELEGTASPDAAKLADGIRSRLREWRDGDAGPEDRPPGEIRKTLEEIYRALPPELQITFADRSDYKRWVSTEPPAKGGQDEEEDVKLRPMLDALQALNDELLKEEDMSRILARLMDAAMSLSGAENGFLVVRTGDEGGVIPGFSVAVARNLTRESLATDEYAFSLSAVRHAIQSARPIVTDNALTDPLFKDARSVHLKKLKSILALPVPGPGGVMGVFYLDHRFEAGLFEGDLLAAMKAFASTAALALQKERMIEELRRANAGLAEKVEAQTDQVEKLAREVNASRLILKNEYGEIVGRSPKMLKVLSLVDRITDSKVPVWIYGESGTGKEAIARALHFNSPRGGKPFVTENCSALPETLLESELFGYVKGAFTQAARDKKGILKYADGGTIFLDEIADMSLNLQAKLLRFLQEGEFRPLGSHEVEKVDVRVVSASNKELAALVTEGKFREDLFFRLNGVTVTLPPLRERLEDLPLLAEHFLKRIAERDGKPPCRTSPDSLKTFLAYSWPGNIRELQNTLETAVLFAEKNVIRPESLEFKPVLLGRGGGTIPPTKKGPARSIDPELERVLTAIRDQGFHRGNAAKALGISRRYLYTKLERLGVKTDLKSLKDCVDRYL